MERIPITIITGYLGAGKTTLLRRLLDYSAANGLQVAVIMNEFGAVAVDQEVIKGKNFDLVELSGGCVCCSLTREFNAAIMELASRPQAPQCIIVETTGLAEPDAMAVDIQQSAQAVRLDSVVTIVDCDALARFPSLGHTGRLQIELADLLVLNKTDLVTPSQIEEELAALTELNPRATLVKCVRGDFDPRLILDARKGPKEIAKLALATAHVHEERHTSRVQTTVIECSAPVSEERFSEFAYGIPPEVYRAKGFVKLDDGRTMLFNFVAGRFELEEWEQDKPITQIVAIGPNGLGEEVIELLNEGLLACASD